jgi:anti-anti-sigma regulatory factor
VTFANASHGQLFIDTAPDVVIRRLGEFTCVVHAGPHMRADTAQTLEQLAATATVDGYRDFVFDLTRVGRYETPALRSLADLWRRLAGLECEVFVAARNPGVVDCLHRVIPARGRWTLQPTVADALRSLLARPV